MQASEFEKALLVEAAWRLAKSNDVNELQAIACVLRNWVVPRLGQEGQFYRSYPEAIRVHYQTYDLRDVPGASEPALIDPVDGLLAHIDGVYSGRTPDITSSHAYPNGARYFGRAGSSPSGSWFTENVLNRQGEHPLIGTFGSQQFFQ